LPETQGDAVGQLEAWARSSDSEAQGTIPSGAFNAIERALATAQSRAIDFVEEGTGPSLKEDQVEQLNELKDGTLAGDIVAGLFEPRPQT